MQLAQSSRGGLLALLVGLMRFFRFFFYPSFEVLLTLNFALSCLLVKRLLHCSDAKVSVAPERSVKT